jgi:hypothetical protein
MYNEFKSQSSTIISQKYCAYCGKGIPFVLIGNTLYKDSSMIISIEEGTLYFVYGNGMYHYNCYSKLLGDYSKC